MAINSGFSHWNWWFPIVMLNYQRVVNPPFFRGFEKASWPCDFGRSTLVNFCRVLPRRVLCMGSCGMIKQVVTHAMRVTNFSIQFENFGVTILIHFTISTVKKLGAAPNHGTKKSVVVKSNLDLESTHQLLNWVSSKLWATRTSSTDLVDHSTENEWLATCLRTFLNQYRSLCGPWNRKKWWICDLYLQFRKLQKPFTMGRVVPNPQSFASIWVYTARPWR